MADAWQPATELERRMDAALYSGSQEAYFRLLSDADVIIPIAPDLIEGVIANKVQPTWQINESDGRTMVEVYTSAAAMRARLGDRYEHFMTLKFREIAASWPDPDWWLIVDPGLPIQGVLPSWFVRQIAGGDSRPPMAGAGGPPTMGGAGGAGGAGSTVASAAPAGTAAPTTAIPIVPDPPAGQAGPGAPVTPAAPGTPAASGDHLRPASGPQPVSTSGPQPTRASGPQPVPASGPRPARAPAATGVAPRPQAQGFEPANDAERALLEAVAKGDDSAFVQVLAAAEAVVPVPPDMDYTLRPGRPGFPWQVQEADGRVIVPLFTSPERMREAVSAEVFTPAATPATDFMHFPFTAVMRYWPDRKYALVVNPGSPVTGTVPGNRIGALAEWADEQANHRQSEPFEPQNEIEQRLIEAAAGGDTDAYFQVMLSAQVLVPADPDTPWGIRPDDAEFPWHAVPVLGSRSVQLFTSLKWMHEAIGSSRFVMPPFLDVIASWPDQGWTLILNPGTPISSVLPGARVRALAAAQADRADGGIMPPEREPAGQDRSARRVAPAEPTRPVHPVQPGRLVQPGRPGQPAQHLLPGRPPQQTPQERPAQPTPTTPHPPTQADRPVPPVAEPTSPASPASPALPASPLPPGRPIEPARPTRPVEVVRPQDLSGPTAGTGQADPPSTGPVSPMPPSLMPPSPMARADETSMDLTGVAEAVAAAEQERVRAAAPAAEPEAEEFEAGNRTDQELFEAAVTGDTDAFLRVLLAANVLVPIPPDAPLDVTPVKPDFRWDAALRDAASVQIFTSLVRLRETLASGLDETLPPPRFVYVDFKELISCWPAIDWEMLLNPGTRIGASLKGDQVRALSEWAVRVGLIDSPTVAGGDPRAGNRSPGAGPQHEVRRGTAEPGPMSSIAPMGPAPAADPMGRPPASPVGPARTPEPAVDASEAPYSAPHPDGRPAGQDAMPDPGPPPPVVMQKVVPPAHVGWYLEQGYDRVGGFVHPAADVSDLQTPIQLYHALGLFYEDGPFTPDDDGVYVIRWPAYCEELYRIPFGGQSEQDLRLWGDAGWVVERPPFLGNGFAAGSAGTIREFKVDSARLPHGAEMYFLARDRSERFIAVYDPDRMAWLRPEEAVTGSPGGAGEAMSGQQRAEAAQ